MKLTLTAAAFTVALATASQANSVHKIVQEEAIRQGVPVGLAMSVARTESQFNCRAVGRHGERGVMQIKPRTARGVGYKGPASGLNNCRTGIKYGMIYLRQAHRRAGGNVYMTAVYYNAGLGTKRKKSAYAEKIVKQCKCGSGAGKSRRR